MIEGGEEGYLEDNIQGYAIKLEPIKMEMTAVIKIKYDQINTKPNFQVNWQKNPNSPGFYIEI